MRVECLKIVNWNLVIGTWNFTYYLNCSLQLNHLNGEGGCHDAQDHGDLSTVSDAAHSANVIDIHDLCAVP